MIDATLATASDGRPYQDPLVVLLALDWPEVIKEFEAAVRAESERDARASGLPPQVFAAGATVAPLQMLADAAVLIREREDRSAAESYARRYLSDDQPPLSPEANELMGWVRVLLRGGSGLAARDLGYALGTLTLPLLKLAVSLSTFGPGTERLAWPACIALRDLAFSTSYLAWERAGLFRVYDPGPERPPIAKVRATWQWVAGRLDPRLGQVGEMETALKAELEAARSRPVTPPTEAVALTWEPLAGIDLDGLPPLPRRLLEHMATRQQASVSELFAVVWGEEIEAVSQNALHQAIHKANAFLRQRGSRHFLGKDRDEMVRWA